MGEKVRVGSSSGPLLPVSLVRYSCPSQVLRQEYQKEASGRLSGRSGLSCIATGSLSLSSTDSHRHCSTTILYLLPTNLSHWATGLDHFDS